MQPRATRRCGRTLTALWVGALLLAALPSVAATPPPRLLVPLPDHRGVSATFGEYREGHLHTGIDLRTGGRDDLPVVAAARGRVVRMRSTRRGYGNVLYLRHAGGWVTVYAHLDRFAPGRLTSLLDEARARHGRYPGEISVDGTIEVAAGELIAYSGESGAGLPHLHFELRDPDGEPVNPLRYLAAFPDHEAPRLRAVSWTPVDAAARVDGDFRPRVDPLHGRRTGAPPRLTGRIAISVDADDSFISDNRCGLYEVGAEVDGRPWYGLRFDRLRFDRVHLSGLLYDLPHSALSPVHYLYKLYREAGNDLSPVTVDGDGLVDTRDLADGRHVVTLYAADAHGHQSRATVAVDVVNGPHTRPAVARAPDSAVSTELRQLDRTLLFRLHGGAGLGEPRLRVQIDGVEVAAPPLEATPDGDYLATLPLTPGQGRRADAWVVGRSSPVSIPLQWVAPGATADYRYDALEVYFPAGSVFAPVGVAMDGVDLPAAEGLPRRAGPVAMEPAGRVLRDAATATFHMAAAEDGERLGVYSWSPATARWTYVGGHWDPEHRTLSTGIRDLGTVAVLEDRWVPRVVDSRPRRGASLSVLPETVYVAVQEHGEGVAEEGCRVELDGSAIPFEYDPDRHWLRPELDGNLATGEHRLTVVVADKAGNVAPPTTIHFTLEPNAS